MLQFDEENARRLEAAYMTADVIEQRRAIRAALAIRPGERVLDIGSGPGFLAAEIAAEVGPTGRVYGVDPSETMLARARRRDATVEYGRSDLREVFLKTYRIIYRTEGRDFVVVTVLEGHQLLPRSLDPDED